MNKQTSERRRKYREYPAPTESARGRIQEDGYRQLAVAVMVTAIRDCVLDRDPCVRLEALFWLMCSETARILTDYLELPDSSRLLVSGQLCNKDVGRISYYRKLEKELAQ